MVKRDPAKTGDITFLTLLIILVLFGVIMVYDATVIYALGTFGEAHRFVLLHIGWLIVGFIGFQFFSRYPHDKLAYIALPIFGVSVFFLAILAFFGVLPCEMNFAFSPCVNGANRWLYFNPPPLPPIPGLGVLGFQPSELAKFSIVIYLSVVLDKLIKNKQAVLKPFLHILGLVAGLVILQPNMSTTMIVITIALSIYFVSGADLKPFYIVVPVIFLLAAVFILSSPYRLERFQTFTQSSENYDLDSDYHMKQILIALGSGGVFGRGFGQSRQKYSYLPEVSSDSIFAIVGEELGLFGTSLVLILFVLLFGTGLSIAKRSSTEVGKMLTTGVMAWLMVQFLINVSAMVKIIPLTGVPLPLISYGGSSTIFLLSALGIVYNVSRSAREL